jgi:hypothetical protein
MTHHERILAFFEGVDTDQSGRTIQEVLAMDDYALENEHDYVQWLFPSPEISDANPGAPVVEEETVRAFAARSDLRGTLLRGLHVMLTFYGLELVEQGDELEVREGPDFEEKSFTWLIPVDHNHLRISRILLSLRTLNCQPHATALLAYLELLVARLPHRFKDQTLPTWRRRGTGGEGLGQSRNRTS